MCKSNKLEALDKTTKSAQQYLQYTGWVKKTQPDN